MLIAVIAMIIVNQEYTVGPCNLMIPDVQFVFAVPARTKQKIYEKLLNHH